MIKIIGKKVTLQEATAEDLDAHYFWRYEEKEQEVRKWNGPYFPVTERTKEEFIKAQQEKADVLPGVPSELMIHVDGKFIGTVNAYWECQHTNWLETGIVIYDKNYWNGGYGTESYHLWIDFLFKATNLHRLGMSTWSGNVRMMRAAEKIGMKEEARIRQARIVDGKFYDAIKMGILREEWIANSFGYPTVKEAEELLRK